MRILIALFAASALVACGESPTPAPQSPAVVEPVPPETPAATRIWSRSSGNEGETLRLRHGDELAASLSCRTDGSFHAASDGFSPVMSEERFTIGAADEAFTLVANLEADRPRGVEASGEIPTDFLDRIEAGQPVAFSYGAQSLGPFPLIPEADARAFAQACRDAAT